MFCNKCDIGKPNRPMCRIIKEGDSNPPSGYWCNNCGYAVMIEKPSLFNKLIDLVKRLIRG